MLVEEPAPPVVEPIKTFPVGCEPYRNLVAQYDWDHRIMMAVMQAESGCKPANHNLTMSENHGVCVGSYGLLQVGCLHYRDGEDRNDPATNIAVAYRVWRSQGYSAWSVYNNSKYLKFL